MDDFYDEINKEWIKNTVLPDDKYHITTFNIIQDDIDNTLIQIIKNDKNLRKMYDKIIKNDVSKKYWKKYFDIIDMISTLDDLLTVLGFFAFYGIKIFFSVSIDRNIVDNTKYALILNETYTTLQLSSLYDTHKDKYSNFINNYCKIIDVNPNGIFSLEYKLSQFLFTLEEKRDINIEKNVSSSIKEIDEYCKFKFSNYFKKLNVNSEEIIIENLNYGKNLIEILHNTNIETLKNYIKYRFIILLNDICKPDELNKLEFDFFLKELLSLKEDYKIDHKILNYVKLYCDDILEKLYVEKYKNVQVEKYICNMVNIIKKSAKEIILNCSWLNEITKQKMCCKIENIKTKVGSRDKFKLKDLNFFLKKNVVDMTLLFKNFIIIENFKKLETDVDKNEWYINSFTVNAYYAPLNNEIVIPYGILTKPFFDIDYSFATNLGGIGTIIAHEISHGFDDQGRYFDKDGKYADWWLKEDIEEYNIRIQKIVEMYDKINVSGKATLGENIADYTGVLIITNVLKNSSKENYINMFTNYAKIWREKTRDNKSLNMKLKLDVHAPSKLRTNVVLSNIPMFKQIFNIKDNKELFNLWS